MATFVKSLTVSIASNGTLSEAAMLGEQGYSQVYVDMPSFSTNAAVRVYGSGDGSTYRYMHMAVPNTATVGTTTMVIASGANNRWIPLPAWAPYMKFQVTGTVCAAADIRVYGVLDQ